MRQFVQVLIDFGPLGILALAAIDSAGIPLAGGADALVILIAIKAPGRAWWAAAAAVLGSIAGNLFLFLAAKRGGRRYMERTREPGSRSVRFRHWFHSYGLLTVFVPALVPIPLPLKIFVISAGALGVSSARFLAVVSLARVLRYFGLAWLGVKFGEGSAQFLKENARELIAGAVVLLGVLYFITWLRARFGKPV